MPRATSFAFLVLLLCSLLAASPAGALEPSEEYGAYTPEGWAIPLLLLADGKLSSPSDADWAREDLDFLWLSASDDRMAYPIYQIDGSTIGVTAERPGGAVMTPEEFEEFYHNMLADLQQDPSFSVIETDANYVAGDDRRWQMFHVEETQGGATEDTADDAVLTYYSLFALDDDGTLRLVNFYYEPGDDAGAEAIALEVMQSIDPYAAEAGE